MAKIEFEYEVFPNRKALDKEGQLLVIKAIEAAKNLAYAPYSKFRVGAALLLDNGIMVQGVNQENAASPAGICAERGALSTASILYPKQKIISLAVAYEKDNLDITMTNAVISPCGICRQTIAEYISRQKSTISLYLCSPKGQIYKLANAMDLLPLSFGAEML